MGRIRLIPLALVTVPVTLFTAQAPSDFNGRWSAVEPQKFAGHELVITQDKATLRLDQVRLHSGETYDQFGRPQGPPKGVRESTTYRLDGTTVVTNVAGQSVRSSLGEDGERIILRDRYHPPGVNFERSLSFDNRGRLVLEHRSLATGDEPAQSSERILDIRRIVFERR